MGARITVGVDGWDRGMRILERDGVRQRRLGLSRTVDVGSWGPTPAPVLLGDVVPGSWCVQARVSAGLQVLDICDYEGPLRVGAHAADLAMRRAWADACCFIDVDEATYHGASILDHRDSGSRIEAFRKYRRGYRLRRPGKATRAFNFGKYFHSLLLDPPGTTGRRFAVAPCQKGMDGEDVPKLVDRRTTAGREAYKAFVAQLGGRVEVDPADHSLALPMLEAIRRNEEAAALLFDETMMREKSAIWRCPETDREMRLRFDLVSTEHDLIVDLKTSDTVDLANRGWVGRLAEWGYHRKAAVYMDAYRQLTGRNAKFVYVFVEKTDDDPQSVVRDLFVDSPEVQIGHDEYVETLHQINECEKADDWREPAVVCPAAYPIVPEWLLSQHAKDFAPRLGGVEEVEGNG